MKMGRPRKSDSEKKRNLAKRRQRFKERRKYISLKVEDFNKLQVIAGAEKITVSEAAAVVIDGYCKKDQVPKGTPPSSEAQASPYPATHGVKTPMTKESLPFFNSPLVPRFNRTPPSSEAQASPYPATHGVKTPMTKESLPFFKSPLVPRFIRKLQDDAKSQDQGVCSSARGSSDESIVERISISDGGQGQNSMTVIQEQQGTPVSFQGSRSDVSVENPRYIEKGDFIYLQESVNDGQDDDDEDADWHPHHNRQKSLCKGLVPILEDEEVFGEEHQGESEDVEATCSGLHHKMTSPDAALQTKLYLVTGSMLQHLALLAQPICHCEKKNSVHVSEAGTSAHITWTCEAKHSSRLCMQETLNQSHVGDLKIASAILLSGNNFLKVKRLADFASLHLFSSRLFLAVQNLYACPVVEDTFQEMVAKNQEKMKGKEIVVCGDARNDSPGFNAQYCTYTLLEHASKDVVAAQFLDKRETKDRSGAMEPAALISALANLKSSGVKVAELVTDAHPTISAILRKDYPDIIHSWDVWHGAKNIGKKISKASAAAANKKLKYWTKHIVNHFWYCAETCNGDAKLFLSKWRGLVHHVTDQHSWSITGGLGGVPHCEHGELDKREEWLTSGTKCHDALVRIVLDKRLLGTIVRYVNFRHTGELESLHSHILMYCSKRFSFGYRAYRARNMLAMLDYNKHKDRPLALDSEGNPKCRSKWSKHSASWVIFEVRVAKTYQYVPVMMKEIFRRRLTDTRPLFRKADPLPEDPRNIRPRLAPLPPPSMEQLKERRRSRFSKQANS